MSAPVKVDNIPCMMKISEIAIKQKIIAIAQKKASIQ
ncbi:hypothetical protein OTSTA716_1555 [Orientia tsutsugamushi str. TA716]|uniref:Uncharacterized protein n=1 Tax=Orientia tsutsugamushi str. TA716 TaxID=1359175 RepID=A0A0F3P311_ORITS|nr:hypothetical protein OTSTA716_2466 [Orientia tsutsugamushi str. TA716]KJV73619.1 hypothetical protein OTSTA716_1555 [Orientia tsutsugamushi str. TA716]